MLVLTFYTVLKTYVVHVMYLHYSNVFFLSVYGYKELIL